MDNTSQNKFWSHSFTISSFQPFKKRTSYILNFDQIHVWMGVLNLLPLNKSIVHNLALFICHLFIDGGFRNGHILYDPSVFDGHLITEIGLMCSVEIPWLTTDITQPSSSPWSSTERTDHILQLIFFDPNRLSEQIDHFKEYFTFYRIFVLQSTTELIETEQRTRTSTIGERNSIFNSSSLIVDYNPKIDSVNVHWITENGEAVGHLNCSTNQCNERLFDQTFRKLDQKRSVEIRISGLPVTTNGHSSMHPLFGSTYIANFFASNLNNSYINMTLIKSDRVWPTSTVIRKERRFYKEILLEYEIMNEQNPYVTHFITISFNRNI